MRKCKIVGGLGNVSKLKEFCIKSQTIGSRLISAILEVYKDAVRKPCGGCKFMHDSIDLN